MPTWGGKAAPCRPSIDQLLAIHLATCALPAGHACGHMFILDGEPFASRPCLARPTGEWMRQQKAECAVQIGKAA